MRFIKTSLYILVFSASSLLAQKYPQIPEPKQDTFSGYDTNQKQIGQRIERQTQYDARIKEVVLTGSKCTIKNIFSKGDEDSLKNVIIPEKLDTITALDKNNSNIKALALTYLGCHSKKDQSLDRILYDTASNSKINDTIRVGAIRGLELSSTPDSTNNLIRINDTINKHSSLTRGNIDTIDSLTGDSRIEAESIISLGNKAYTGKKEQAAHTYLTTVMKADSRASHRVSRWNAAIVLGQNGDPAAGQYLANIATGSDYGGNKTGELKLRQDAYSIIAQRYNYLITNDMDKNGNTVQKVNGRPYLIENLKKELAINTGTESAMFFVISWFAFDGALGLISEWGPVAKVLEKLEESFPTAENATRLASTDKKVGTVLGETGDGLTTPITTTKKITQAAGTGKAPLNTAEYNSWVNGMNAKQLTAIDNTVAKYGVKLDDGLKQSLLDAHQAGGLSGADKVTKLREFSNLKTYLMDTKGLSEADAKQFILDLADKDVMVLGTPPAGGTTGGGAAGTGANETKSAEDLMKSYESPYVGWDESKSVSLVGSTSDIKTIQLNVSSYNKQVMRDLVTKDRSIREFFDWEKNIDYYIETNKINLAELTNTRKYLDRQIEDLEHTINNMDNLKYDNKMFERKSYDAYIASLRKQLETSTTNGKKVLDEAIRQLQP